MFVSNGIQVWSAFKTKLHTSRPFKDRWMQYWRPGTLAALTNCCPIRALHNLWLRNAVHKSPPGTLVQSLWASKAHHVLPPHMSSSEIAGHLQGRALSSHTNNCCQHKTTRLDADHCTEITGRHGQKQGVLPCMQGSKAMLLYSPIPLITLLTHSLIIHNPHIRISSGAAGVPEAYFHKEQQWKLFSTDSRIFPGRVPQVIIHLRKQSGGCHTGNRDGSMKQNCYFALPHAQWFSNNAVKRAPAEEKLPCIHTEVFIDDEHDTFSKVQHLCWRWPGSPVIGHLTVSGCEHDAFRKFLYDCVHQQLKFALTTSKKAQAHSLHVQHHSVQYLMAPSLQPLGTCIQLVLPSY